MDRSFDPCHVEYGDKRVRGYKITCGRDGKVARMPVNTVSNRDDGGEYKQAARKFEALGWFVGKRERDDRCPECVAIAKAIGKKQEAAPMHGTNGTGGTNGTVKPAEMGPDDFRIIYEKINDVWEEGNHNYKGGWHDRRVAENLNVPKVWVTKVRSSAFGDKDGNADMEKAIADAEEVVKRAKDLTEKVRTIDLHVQAIKKEIAPWADKVDRVERSIVEIRNSLR